MVEWKKLGEVCAFNRGRTITAKDAVDGDIPVIAGGQTPSYYHNESNREGESITVAGSGAYAGFVSYWNKPIFVSDAFTVDPSQSIKHKYLFQWLKMNQNRIFETQKGAGVPHVHGKDIANILIPIPSLSEQTRIVGILDTFTSAIDNLKEQITLRRKQYEYYRDQLLYIEGKPGVEMKTLGEVCEIFDGTHQTPSYVKSGIKFVSVENIKDIYSSCKYISLEDYQKNYKTKPQKGDVLMTRIGDVGSCAIVYGNEPIAYYVSLALLRPSIDILLSHYLKYILESKTGKTELRKRTLLTAVPLKINLGDIGKIRLPLPPLSEQSRIVSILDTFEASIHNLEAQLEQRQKQYKYYRNKLLTFE